MALNERQKRFCNEYIIDLNATQAAIRAGYEFTIEAKRYFVYALVDSGNNEIFYIGKGIGNRPYDHYREYLSAKTCNEFKIARIRQIIESGNEVSIVFLIADLDEQVAFENEKQIIELIGAERLTNIKIRVGIEHNKQWATNFLARLQKLSSYLKQTFNPLYIEYYLRVVAEVSKIAS